MFIHPVKEESPFPDTKFRKWVPHEVFSFGPFN